MLYGVFYQQLQRHGRYGFGHVIRIYVKSEFQTFIETCPEDTYIVVYEIYLFLKCDGILQILSQYIPIYG